MVPRISKRGHSFIGAAKYYLHDKKADTDERVAWTHTHNIPTDNAQKAFGWMAYTALNAERLKREANVVHTGRKTTAGAVYSYSLAWHPNQAPKQQEMQEAALEVLENLGLNEHEAVLVAHKDTKHPHVHVICNLVNPENGKTMVPSYDYLTASRWAENIERNDGQIYCEQRVINNEKRRQLGFQSEKSKIIKHREIRLENAKQIQSIYETSSTGLEFQSALKNAGFILARGDRRGFVIVDEKGEISSLSRQLKGQRAKDIRERLQDVFEIPSVSEISIEKKQFDKRRHEEVNAKIHKENNNKDVMESLSSNTESDEFLKKLDALRSWEQKVDAQKIALEKAQEEQYGRKELIHKIESLESLLNKRQNKKVSEELEALKKSLETIDRRITEQNEALQKKSLQSKPPTSSDELNRSEEQKNLDYIRKLEEKRKANRNKGRKGPKM